MLGREAYHNPWLMADWDERFFGQAPSGNTRESIEEAMVEYMERFAATGAPFTHVSRHILGLWNGLPGARRRRQVWSDPTYRALGPRGVSRLARSPSAGAQPVAA